MNSATTVQPFMGDTRPLGPYTISQWHQIAQNAAAVPQGDPGYPQAQAAKVAAARYIRGWTAERVANYNAPQDQADARPHPGIIGSGVVGFGQGAGARFTDELAGVLNAGSHGVGPLGLMPRPGAYTEGVNENRAYLQAAREDHPVVTGLSDAVGTVTGAVAGQGVVGRLFPGIGRIAAEATQPVNNFIGMFSHLPAKLATVLIGGGESGAITAAHAAGATEGGLGKRAGNAALGFAAGSLVGGKLTAAGVYGTLVARTALKGLAPIFSGWRGAAGARAVEAGAVEAGAAPAVSASEQAFRDALARLPGATPADIEDKVRIARQTVGHPLYEPAPVVATPSGVRPQATPAMAGDPADRIPGFIRRQSDTGPVPPPVVGEAQMPGTEVMPFLEPSASGPVNSVIRDTRPHADAARQAFRDVIEGPGPSMEVAKKAAASAAARARGIPTVAGEGASFFGDFTPEAQRRAYGHIATLDPTGRATLLQQISAPGAVPTVWRDFLMNALTVGR